MVVVYHNINDGWIYPGGHADGEEKLLDVAIREVEEETGLKVKILDHLNVAVLGNQFLAQVCEQELFLIFQFHYKR